MELFHVANAIFSQIKEIDVPECNLIVFMKISKDY